MPGYSGHFWPALGGDTAQITMCPPREINSCGTCSCEGGSEMCFGCAASQSLSSPYKAHQAKSSGDDDDTEEFVVDAEFAAAKRASKALAESECFICEGFSEKTCAIALTTVIANLEDASRLAIERELLDADAASCGGGGSGSSEECLTKLDAKLGALATSEKLDLVGSMCELIEDSAGLGSAKAKADAKGALGIHESKAEVKAAARAAKLQAGLTLEGQAKAVRKMEAQQAKEEAEEAKRQKEEEGKRLFKQSKSSSCSMCQGFSSKTCALALTNVISGLDDRTRFDIHSQLLDAPSLCPGFAASALGGGLGGGADAGCLARLDETFGKLGVGAKVGLVENMCTLLQEEDAKEAHGKQSSEAKESSAAAAAAAAAAASARLSSTDDEAAAAAAHAVNTRSALLLGGRNSEDATSSSSDASAAAAATTSKTAVKIEALLATVEEEASPQCLLCEGLSDRACLAALDASFHGLTDVQRLAVSRRVLSGYPTFTTCAPSLSGASDASCLAALDGAFATLGSEDRLNLLTDACTLGAYGAAASALAATAAAATGAPAAVDTAQALAAAASGQGFSGFAPLPTGCDAKFCVAAKDAAVAAADALSAMGGAAFLAGGATKKKLQQDRSSSWKAVLAQLAAAALPSVTPSATTGNIGGGGGGSASTFGGVALPATWSAAHAALAAAPASTYRALKTSMLAAASAPTTTAASEVAKEESPPQSQSGLHPVLSFFGGALAAMAFASTFFAVKRNFSSTDNPALSNPHSRVLEQDAYAPIPEKNTGIQAPEAAHPPPAFVLSL